MFRNNKMFHSPEHWCYGINPLMYGDEQELRAESSVLQDRWRRGMTLFSQLLDLPWWAWRRDRAVVRQLGILRDEYRGHLEFLNNARIRKRAINVPYGSTAKFVRPNERGQQEEVDVMWYRDYHRQPPIIVPQPDADDEERFRKIGEKLQDEWRTMQPFEPVHTTHSPQSYSGHGGDYGGAGASDSWDSGGSSCDTSSSSDSGSSGGDCGSGSTDD